MGVWNVFFRRVLFSNQENVIFCANFSSFFSLFFYEKVFLFSKVSPRLIFFWFFIIAALKVFSDALEKYQVTPWKGELMRRLIETEDTGSLQLVMNASIKVHGETNSLYDLAFAFVECGRTKQAQKIFDTPGLRARQDRLDRFAERVIERGSLEQMESLLTATRDVFDVDRDALYRHLIRLCGKLGDPDKALAAWINMQEEVWGKNRSLDSMTGSFFFI